MTHRPFRVIPERRPFRIKRRTPLAARAPKRYGKKQETASQRNKRKRGTRVAP